MHATKTRGEIVSVALPDGIRDPLTVQNSLLLYVDLQPQYVFSVHTINAGVLINNAVGLAKAAKLLGVPTIFARIAEEHGGAWGQGVYYVDQMGLGQK
jgi:nicotinamidase-related amidase